MRDADAGALAELQQLEELSLDSCRVGACLPVCVKFSGRARAHPSVLNRRLRAFVHAYIIPPGNAGLTSLQGLAKLRKLNLADTAITDGGLEALAALPLLSSLSLFYCAITDQGVRHLAALGNLRRLNLDSRDITDGGLEALAALTKLQHLDLFSARVSDMGLCFLSSLSFLTGACVRGSVRGVRAWARLGFGQARKQRRTQS